MDNESIMIRSRWIHCITLIAMFLTTIGGQSAEKNDPFLEIFQERCSIAFCVTVVNNGRDVVVETLKGPKFGAGSRPVELARAVIRVAQRRRKDADIVRAFGYVTKDEPNKLSVEIIDRDGNLSSLKKNITAIRLAFAKK
ncbi:MAG: hypothetical protein J0M04_07645 [Verrucomicrobia bacterium]|nr:hypothetical protein [Verrucomicrobiota bacterium]